jgi:hypothetical protein
MTPKDEDNDAKLFAQRDIPKKGDELFLRNHIHVNKGKSGAIEIYEELVVHYVGGET